MNGDQGRARGGCYLCEMGDPHIFHMTAEQWFGDGYEQRLDDAVAVSGDKFDAAERVTRGVAWLNEHRPGWAADIDLGKLDMMSCYRCILGQLYGYFWGAPFMAEMGDTDGSAFAADLGMQARDKRTCSREEYRALADEWRRRIVAAGARS